ncbi:sulfatase [uncultured Roseobacter sp.]|uniref:sulfatase n=1 Tax=uncultured Roseobacter sp. TaxID=114847 RepID=UPI0026100934|nr:sulfatase [uncultured Roseobacter sp.]
MNIILILVDSLNKDALRIYNPDTVCQTPSLDAFAAKSLVFDNHFISSLPCMPARREIFAGRKEFMWRPWGSLEVFDPRLPREVQKQGYNTGMVTDHYHYWEETANGYMQGFMTLEMIRGHETDYHQLPRAGDVPKWVEKMCEHRSPYHMRQYWENVKDFGGEEDYFPAKTFTAASNWLRKNAEHGPFFLQVESFDVHEPFHVPAPYDTMYTGDLPGDAGDYNIWPPYQVYADLDAFMDQTTPEELAYLKAQYYGKTTMVDTWLGRFLDTVGDLNLWDDTMIIFTTDHGHDLGERGVFGKQYPHYDSHANIPMMIWHPEHQGNGTRSSALTQTVDLFSTIIDASGGTSPAETRHSKSLMPLVSKGKAPHADITYGTFGQGVCITDGEWTLFKSPVDGQDLFSYSTMIARPLLVDNPVDGRVGAAPAQPVGQAQYDPSVPYPMWKMPIKIDPRTYENFLFHRAQDPDQQTNLWDSHPAERDRMMALLHQRLEDEGCPPEQLERLGLNPASIAAE